jgi:peptide/nickel transport system ATP-binding protein
LLDSIPYFDAASHARPKRARLNEIKGMVPVLSRLPAGCAFAPRCFLATERCRREVPPLSPMGDGHVAACWHAERVADAA